MVKTTKNSTFQKNLSMFSLFNTYFFKTIYGPGLSLVFPSILLIIMGNILKLEYVFPGIVAFTTLIITVQALPLGMMEMKNSTLFKYIGASPVSSKSFISIIILYYIFINLISVFLLIFTAMAAFPTQVFTGHRSGLFSGIVTIQGSFSFLFANLLHISLGLSVGITISTFSKTPQQALTIALLIVFPTMFLSGMIITVDIIAQSKAMQIISYLMPFKYTTGNIIVSATPIGQMGDFLTLLSYDGNHNFNTSNLDIIFKQSTPLIDPKTGSWVNSNGYDANGKLWFNTKEVSSVDELFAIHDYWASKGQTALKTNFLDALVKDQGLFDLLFVKARENISVNSNNNIFDIIDSFGVRRVPDIEKIKEFIKNWLDSTKVNGAVDSTKVGVLGAINANNYSWMDMFTKQSTTLYQVYDRSLNIFLPMVIVAGLQFYSIKNFKWTSR